MNRFLPLLLAALLFGCTKTDEETAYVTIGDYCRESPWYPTKVVRLNILPNVCPGTEGLMDDSKYIDLTYMQNGDASRIRNPSLDSLETGSSENLTAWECYADFNNVGLPCRTLTANVQITHIDSSSVNGYFQLYEGGKKIGSRVHFLGSKCPLVPSCQTN